MALTSFTKKKETMEENHLSLSLLPAEPKIGIYIFKTLCTSLNTILRLQRWVI